jgi:hypothetical protein
MLKGKKYYHFPYQDAKQKYLAIQQKEVEKYDELVKNLDDSQQGLLNFLKNSGPELQLNSVGDVGCASNLPVYLITGDDEFRTYLGNNPVTVRGIKTDKLAVGSKLDGKVMFVSGIESGATRFESSKVNIFILREVPDDVLLEHLKISSGGLAAAANKSAVAGSNAAKSVAGGSATPAAAAKNTDFRTWSDKSGKYQLEAQLVTRVDDKVVLKRHDNGELITLPIDKLSQLDQDFLKSNVAAAKP